MTNKQLLDHSNGNGNGNGKHHKNGTTTTQVKDYSLVSSPAQPVTAPAPVFIASEQPVLLERPSWWSHAFVWGIVGVTAGGILWACLAPIEQAVPAMGKLEAEGAAKELRAPNGGVVREIFVKDGDRVKAGQLLLTFDPTAPQADLDALKKQRETLLQENRFYSANVNGANITGTSELATLTRLRSNLIAETQFLQSLINGVRMPGGGSGEFDANQRGLIDANRAESKSREAAAQLQIRELEQQLRQVEVQIAAAVAQLPKDRERLVTTRQQLAAIQQQFLTARRRLEENKERLATAKGRLEAAKQLLPQAQQREATALELLGTDKELLGRVEPLAKEGAVAQLQVTRQRQQLLTRQNDLLQRQSEVVNSRNEISARIDDISKNEDDMLRTQDDMLRSAAEISRIQSEISARESEMMNRQADIDRFKAEQKRLNVAINQAGEQWQNAKALSEKDIRTKIAENQKRISEIDTQLGRLKLENQKRLLEIESQLQKAEQAVQYQEMRAPVDGKVFDLKPNSPGYVVRAIDQEPVLKIVPTDTLVASVNLTNKDIGHVQPGMEVDINVESFPSTEFGIIKGKLLSIGSDALAPTQERPFYSFPARIQMERQSFMVNGQELQLQSGMAVNATIKVRKRKVIDIFLEMFQKQTDSLKNVR